MKNNQTTLQLPFQGEWFVVWGGDTKEQNQQHHNSKSQRHALDLVVIDDKGSSFKGGGEHTEDHYAFGKEIFSPGAGEVIQAIGSVVDNDPGTMISNTGAGNYVLIKHREGEYSILAHLRQRTVTVSVGEQVENGQKIGECGNSGFSTQPHLHFHMQDSEMLLRKKDGELTEVAAGIKCYFSDIMIKREDKSETLS